MDGATFQFIAYGLIVALISNLGSSPRWRFAVLLGASMLLIFLLSPDLTADLPLAGFLALGYLSVAALRRGVGHAQALGVIALVACYVWLKQYSFLPAASFLHFPYFTLGLSYIFFRVLHLVIEAGRPGPAREIGAGQYLAYTLNFTTLVSGPIQRFDEFHRDQAAAPPLPVDAAIVGRQLERIVRGFFKVNVLGLIFSTIQIDALAELTRPGMTADKLFAAWRLVACYPFFLYCNFSGYIDIVIAMARLMRLRLPENFDRPFSATSFLDFWNRWHITLSTWLKTYVYNPLLIALMRRNSSAAMEPVFGIACFFVTFFLIGIWHGRTSEYAFFGVLQGGGVALNKLWQVVLTRRLGRKRYRQIARGDVYAACARGLTFTWFAMSLVWFWASWTQIGAGIAAIGSGRWTAVLAILWLTATAALATWEAVRHRLLTIAVADAPVLSTRYARLVFTTIFAALSFLIVAVLSQPAPGIVYRTF